MEVCGWVRGWVEKVRVYMGCVHEVRVDGRVGEDGWAQEVRVGGRVGGEGTCVHGWARGWVRGWVGEDGWAHEVRVGGRVGGEGTCVHGWARGWVRGWVRVGGWVGSRTMQDRHLDTGPPSPLPRFALPRA